MIHGIWFKIKNALDDYEGLAFYNPEMYLGDFSALPHKPSFVKVERKLDSGSKSASSILPKPM